MAGHNPMSSHITLDHNVCMGITMFPYSHQGQIVVIGELTGGINGQDLSDRHK